MEPIITSCRIDPAAKSMEEFIKLGNPGVHACFDHGTEEKKLFDFYPDEICFTAEEFIGLTEGAAHDLRHARDVAYLRGSAGISF